MHIHPIDLIADMNPNIIFRTPTVADGAGIWRIVQESGVLDLNSAYMYLLLSKDFADTCIVAERDNQLVGFATGYRPPKRPDSIFLWQIGIDAALRGQGLGKQLLIRFLLNEGAQDAKYLETTISPSNEASQNLFQGLARDLKTNCDVSPGFTEQQFPSGHEAEELYRIGPLSQQSLLKLSA